MKVFINVCTPNKQIIFFDKTNINFHHDWDIAGVESKNVLPNIYKGLNELNLDISKDIEEIIILNGPGSFTGTRVVCSVINAIKYLYPNIIIKNLTVGELFSLVNNSVVDCYFFQIYASDIFVFDKDGELVKRISTNSDNYLDEFKDKKIKGIVLEEIESKMNEIGLDFGEINIILNVEFINIISEQSDVSPEILVPFYGKEANVTRVGKS